MVATRRRTEPAQVSPPAAKKVLPIKRPVTKETKEVDKEGSVKEQKKVKSEKRPKKDAEVKKSVEETEQDEGSRKRILPSRKEAVDVEKKSLSRRSLPPLVAPVEEKKSRIEQKTPVVRKKAGKRKLVTPDSNGVEKGADTADFPMGKRSLPPLVAPVEEKKSRIEQKTPVVRKKAGKRKLVTPDSNGVEKGADTADSPIKSLKATKFKSEQGSFQKEGDMAEEMKQNGNSDRSPVESKLEEEMKQTAKEKPKHEQDEDDWEQFGNSSGDEDEPDRSKLKKKEAKKKVKSSKAASKPSNEDEDGEESSSSSAASDSESESLASAVASSGEEPDTETETEASSAVEDPDDSDASFSPSKATSKQTKRRSGEKGGPSSRPQGGSSKSQGKSRVSSTSKSTKSRESAASKASVKIPPSRPTSSKPLRPWQKVNEQPVVEGDIVVPVRTLRRGERKMAKFRVLAAALAVGKNVEMTQEEASRIVSGMKAKCVTKDDHILPSATSANAENTDNDASSSEDEWEEMVPVETEETKGKHVQVTLKKAEEKDWWGLYLKQEVNKCVRDNWENCHKVNILCYIGHLQYLRKVILEESLIPSLMLTMMPSGYQALVGKPMTLENARKMIKYFHSSFKASGAPITFEPGLCRFDATARYSEMVSRQEFETDADRAVLLFALFVSMECIARICVNTQTIPRKWDAKVLKDVAKMKANSDVTKMNVSSGSSADSSKEKTKSKGTPKKKTDGADHKGKIRNYWVEYWDRKQNKWICVDPLRVTVDDPNSIEENLSKPVVYVLAIDSEGGVREVTARYAADFSHPNFRRNRTDQSWLARTLRKKMIRAEPKRAQLEDVQLRQELVNKPLPATLSEYKNHPLYVLEKDLLKFEGLYPRAEDQKPLGEVRGHKVYPRSTVYTLQSATNWIKMARSVKEGEKAYKVVKARPNLRVPAEEREQKYLDVFGYWQTEPFRRPKGKIPRNDFGNVYMYVPSMCPVGTVHLRLPGLVSIARRLGGLECVPALVGWEFNSCTNFPIIEGAVVLEEDVDKFITEYKRIEATREERENKRREERVFGNWRKLIRGILRLHYVQSKFLATKPKAKGRKKKEVKEETEEQNGVIDRTVMAERQVFTHDDLMNLKR
ncbi:DNA repair protein Rad4 [Cooperia oncophora]